MIFVEAGITQVYVGLALAIPTVLLGYLTYRRGMHGDRVAQQAGIATAATTGIGQVLDGLNKIITALQSDNDDLRVQVSSIRETVDEVRARLDAVETDNYDLRAKNRELEREIASLHAENAALKVENTHLRARLDELEHGSSK